MKRLILLLMSFTFLVICTANVGSANSYEKESCSIQVDLNDCIYDASFEVNEFIVYSGLVSRISIKSVSSAGFVRDGFIRTEGEPPDKLHFYKFANTNNKDTDKKDYGEKNFYNRAIILKSKNVHKLARDGLVNA
jgi:hypothetical protein